MTDDGQAAVKAMRWALERGSPEYLRTKMTKVRPGLYVWSALGERLHALVRMDDDQAEIVLLREA